MFNRSAYNKLRFNQSAPGKTLSAKLESSSSMSATDSAIMTLKSEMKAEANVQAKLFRQFTNEATLSAESDIAANNMRIVWHSSYLHADGEIHAQERQYRNTPVTFIGTLNPLDTALIDSNQLTVLLNGQNALHLMQGEFFDFLPGENVWSYEDNETVRIVAVQVFFRDRFV